MNAAEAKKHRSGSTLLERTKSDAARAARIDRLVASASVEQLVQAIMHEQHISAAELARRLKAKPPQISRDLRGGLSRATVSRLSTIAEALGYDFVPAFVPRSNAAKRKRFLDMYSELIPNATTTRNETVKQPKTQKAVSGTRRRRVA